MKFDTYVFFSKICRKFQLLYKDLCRFMIVSRWDLLRVRNILHESCTENQNTHVLCSVTSFTWKSCSIWADVEKRGGAREATDDNIILRMRFACWITKATHTHSTCGILFAFPRQQWLHSASQCYVIRALPVFCVLCWCCLAIMLWKAKVYLKTLLARDNA
jgi:hypothetical protein